MKCIATAAVLMLTIVAFSACRNRKRADNRQNPRDSVKMKGGSIQPRKTEPGGRLRPAKHNLKEKFNDEPPRVVPKKQAQVPLKPENAAFKLKGVKAGTQEPVRFGRYNELGGATPTAHMLNPEPSVAENGNVVMTTGNFWVSVSKDGGQTFTTADPTSIFPQDYGGFCCDQVLQYVPRYDLFVWLLQYGSNAAGTNAIRIAVASTEEVRNSNGTAWTYWDFTNTTFATSGALDYNDMSYGSTFLYWSSSVGGAQNRYVIRVPLEQMRARATVNFQFTGATNALWSHVTQNGDDGVYWAGHKDNATMTVYSMMDRDGFYSWRDVAVNPWPNDSISSVAANGTDWLQDAWWKTYVRAAAIRGNTIYFAWNASRGGGFPQPHVQIVAIDKTTFARTAQMQIWNPDFAFAYPYFETNAQGSLGMITAFGGGAFNASSGVGVWGDFVIYYPRLSDLSQGNYGHYHTARRGGGDNSQWVAAGYTHKSNGSVLPYYVRFSH